MQEQDTGNAIVRGEGKRESMKAKLVSWKQRYLATQWEVPNLLIKVSLLTIEHRL